MSMQSTVLEVEYPESDGRPMGETDLHRDWMFRIIEMLKFHFRGQRVYVSGDLLVYYEEGNPRKFVVPDAFVVLDCAPHDRRTFKIWEEGRVPTVAFETTSRSTRAVDEKKKPAIYKRLGIPEYFLYDPTADYLNPPLVGHRLGPRGYEPIKPDADGRLFCRELDIHLALDVDGDLVMLDAATGERMLTEAEAAQSAAESERSARLAAEAELERLKEELRRRGS